MGHLRSAFLWIVLSGCGEKEPWDTGPDPADGDRDGFTTAEGDCDDDNAAVNPEAEEICGDGADNDCDGAADCEDAASCGEDSHCVPKLHGYFDAYEEADVIFTGADFFGWSVIVGDVTGEGTDDLLSLTMGDENEDCFLYAFPGEDLSPENRMTVDPQRGNSFDSNGNISIVDFNGDAVNDICGAVVPVDGLADEEVVNCVAGPLPGDDTRPISLLPPGGYGKEIDQVDDYLVISSDQGVYFYGVPTSDSPEHEYTITGAGTDAAWSGRHYLWSASDFNADGFADLLLGEDIQTDGETTVLVYLGPIIGDMTASDADSTIALPGQLRTGTLRAADVDGDGKDDLAALTMNIDDGANCTVSIYPDLEEGPAVTMPAGMDSMVLGDFDGSGRADVATSQDDEADIVYDPQSGVYEGSDFIDAQIVYSGGADYFGKDIATGDLNADAFDDLVITDSADSNYDSAVLLFFGGGSAE